MYASDVNHFPGIHKAIAGIGENRCWIDFPAAELSNNCGSGTTTAINLITITKGEVSGNKLSPTANAPLGAAVRAVLDISI